MARTAQSTVAAGATIESRDPLTGELLGTVDVASPDEVAERLALARRVQRAWGTRSVEDRAAVMARVAHALLDRLDEAAALVTRENGKPLGESYVNDCFPSLDVATWLARHAPRHLRPHRLAHSQIFLLGRRGKVLHEPLGVVGVISPWNFPLSIPFGQVGAAVVAGNAVVLKPAPATPLVGSLIEELYADAGAPEGLVQVVHGDAETGQALAGGDIDLMVFTGSTEVGRSVMQTAAARMTPTILELGGKDAMLVLDDADLDVAVEGALWGSFCNSGQACASIERIYVHDSLYDPFVERFSARAQELRHGPGLELSSELGVMTTAEQHAKVVEMVNRARAAGATVLTGGAAAELSDQSYLPTVIVDAAQDSEIVQEEVFGPVVAVNRFSTDAEAVRLANDNAYGLSTSVWTGTPSRGRAMAPDLDSGSVWINEHMFSFGAYQAPWGGRKASGVGVTHGAFGLWRNAHQKYVGGAMGPLPVAPLWWFPYGPGAANVFTSLMRVMYSPGAAAKASAAWRNRSAVADLARELVRRW